MEISPSGHPVLLFDGVCNLCNASVAWVIRRDRKGVFRFASLQSDFGKACLEHFGPDARRFDSVVLVDGDLVRTRSEAVLEICRILGGFWRLLVVFRVLPRGLRDGVYDLVARNRYKWFGRKESCMMPRPEWKNRFL